MDPGGGAKTQGPVSFRIYRYCEKYHSFLTRKIKIHNQRVCIGITDLKFPVHITLESV